MPLGAGKLETCCCTFHKHHQLEMKWPWMFWSTLLGSKLCSQWPHKNVKVSVIQRTPLLYYFTMYIILFVLCTLYVGWGVLMQLWITYSDTLFIWAAISGSGVRGWRSGWLWPSARGHGLIMPSYRCNRMPPPKPTQNHPPTHPHTHARTHTNEPSDDQTQEQESLHTDWIPSALLASSQSNLFFFFNVVQSRHPLQPYYYRPGLRNHASAPI